MKRMEKTDLMIDLETLGRSPGSVILSIGAVYFNPIIPHMWVDPDQKFYRVISIESSLAFGLKIEGETLAWWFNQSKEAIKAATHNPQHIDNVLRDFSGFYCSGIRIWSRGRGFDLSLLRAAYEQMGSSTPWTHRDERCARTPLDMIERLTGVKIAPHTFDLPFALVKHHALDDAIRQTYEICNAYQYLSKNMKTVLSCIS